MRAGIAFFKLQIPTAPSQDSSSGAQRNEGEGFSSKILGDATGVPRLRPEWPRWYAQSFI